MMKMIKTPFGIGFASSEKDYENMMMFVEGAKAMMSFMTGNSGVESTGEGREDGPDDRVEEVETKPTTQLDQLTEKVDAWLKKDARTVRELWRKVDREIREHFPEVTDAQAEEYVLSRIDLYIY